MKNMSIPVDGKNVAFDEDGTMRYIAMKVVNMNEDRRWQQVFSSLRVYVFLLTFTSPRQQSAGIVFGRVSLFVCLLTILWESGYSCCHETFGVDHFLSLFLFSFWCRVADYVGCRSVFWSHVKYLRIVSYRIYTVSQKTSQLWQAVALWTDFGNSEQGLKYLKMSTTHREGRLRGRGEWGLGRGAEI